ncbi:MAG: MazG nucleotide pyrophosphohydrolase domain-containing protein [Bradymonadales bacterium]|jgi:uncharacterized protein YabN with tetrapyrrole methylase and pyrophosphatase domain
MNDEFGDLLNRAHKISTIASNMGFDWAEASDVYAKMQEEMQELAQALAEQDLAQIEAESGDLFFAMLNFHRLLGISSLQAFAKGVSKFERRFLALEEAIRSRGQKVEELSASELDEVWENLKLSENR